MKRKFIKYLLLFSLLLYPCLFAVTACKDNSGGTEQFVNLSESEESYSVEESSSPSSSIIEEYSSENDTSENTSIEDSSIENSSIDEDLEDFDFPQDDFSEGDTPAREHSWVIERIDPTCTEKGYYKEWCETCKVVIEEYTIKELGHNIVEVEGYAPTCQAVGKTSYSYCEKCKEFFTEQEDIPMVEHDYTSGLGSCVWCDKCVLRYEVRERYEAQERSYYAVCVGAEEYTPFTIIRVLEIPDYIEAEQDGVKRNIPVTEIAENAFCEWHDINKVILGKNITKIGEKAFRKCLNIREIYDKSSMKVGELSLKENGYLTEFVNPEDIHYTKEYTSKILEDKESGCILFASRNEVELIGIRDTQEHLVIPEGVTKINGGVFYKTMVIRKLTIAKSVKYIAPQALLHIMDEFKDGAHLQKEKTYTPIQEIVMLNPQGWCFYEFSNANEGKKIPVSKEEIEGENSVTWQYLVYDYAIYYCAREEYFTNQPD